MEHNEDNKPEILQPGSPALTARDITENRGESELIARDSTPITTSTTTATTSNVKPSIADVVGGSQTRRYLNDKVTPYLLDGMRLIAVEQPEDPLKRLGEYLIEQSEKINK
ncbi:hypothetical protein KAFR_0K02510 [Kazachstania africana CBS 2517]|uniref:Uncharacterized protein n=1 Tax=Kazachstania africana (strain ATCC 22294 / BCRC 22015 / CBS 2517 / CECT 1963 / NBRC 1671 / NRRL Y-8276) TaxID=1071382 RepID=H2B1V7_KAZAF|nr:hypothetical protein KAFR_0K02510 [Kazachstania africana CBS 2517]CCF60607.1 hypothetical protein KAFR_0K02510 [Kazachstania africana CBS 2517]